MSIVNIVTIYRSLDLYFVPKDLQEDKEKIYINTNYLHGICNFKS